MKGGECEPKRCKQAEELAERTPLEQTVEDLTAEGASSLVHELRIHQVELEMQNEQLRQTQSELDVSRSRYFDLYDLAPVSYLTLDEQGIIQEINLMGTRQLGGERGALIGEALSRFVFPDDQDIYYFNRMDILQKRYAQKAFELRMVKRDGSVFWVWIEMMLTKNEADVTVCRTIIMDIAQRKQAERRLEQARLQLEEKVQERTADLVLTNQELLVQIAERKKVEAALQKREEYFRTIVEFLPIAILTHTDTAITYANNTALRLLDSAQHHLAGTSLLEYIHARDREDLMGALSKLWQGESQIQWLSVQLIPPTGRVLDAEIIMTRAAHSLIHIAVADVTDRRLVDEERLKVQKLQSIGVLAGGIAHDLNNYLAVMLGNVALLRMSNRGKHDPDKVEKFTGNIEKAILQARSLSQQLFTFSTGGQPVKEAADLKSLLVESINLARSGSNVECRVRIADDLKPVRVDRGQISQAIHNVSINAVQAMPEGGVLWVEAENITIRGAGSRLSQLLPEGDYVRVLIKDEGVGIPPDLLSRVFDPFFTTKEQGTGLGLATAYTIFKKHDGHIQVASAEGQGAAFTIFLPAFLREEAEESIVEETAVCGSGKLLVMDDEEAVRETIGGMLSQLGYEVHYAQDGAEAVQMYLDARHSNQPFGLVVMDLTVPGGMGGQQAMEVLVKEDPAIKAVVCSGYSSGSIMANYEQYGFCGAIGKPFQLKELSHLVAGALRGTRGSGRSSP